MPVSEVGRVTGQMVETIDTVRQLKTILYQPKVTVQMVAQLGDTFLGRGEMELLVGVPKNRLLQEIMELPDDLEVRGLLLHGKRVVLR